MSEPVSTGKCTRCGCSVRMVVEDYFSFGRLAAKFDFAERSIRDWAAKGEFGPADRFLRRGNDVRVPTSGVLFFIDANLARHDQARALANKVRGRTLGEARRRLYLKTTSGRDDAAFSERGPLGPD